MDLMTAGRGSGGAKPGWKGRELGVGITLMRAVKQQQQQQYGQQRQSEERQVFAPRIVRSGPVTGCLPLSPALSSVDRTGGRLDYYPSDRAFRWPSTPLAGSGPLPPYPNRYHTSLSKPWGLLQAQPGGILEVRL